MKKIILLIMLIVCTHLYCQAQEAPYKSAVGLLVWNGFGASFKTFIKDRSAIELRGYFDKNGTRITGLLQFHGEVAGINGLLWYAGPGAHVAFYKLGGAKQSSTFVGIDGVIGIDYKFNETPIDLFLDWQPTYEFGNSRGAYISWGGMGIRYTF